MNILDSMWVALGFQVDDKGIDELKEKSEMLRNSALKLGAVFAGAAVGVGLFVEKVAKNLGELYEFSELNKVSARDLKAWSDVGATYGITADSMRESLGGLNMKLGEAAAGIGRGKMLFEKLGFSAHDAHGKVKTLDQMIGELSARMQKSSRAENIAIAQRLGMDPKMVLLLEQGADAVKNLRDEAAKLNPLKEEDYEMAHKVELAYAKAQRMLAGLMNMLAVKLMPMVLKSTQAFIDWLKQVQQSEKFRFIFKIITDTIETLTQWVFRLIGGITSLINWMSKFKVVTYATVAILTLLVAQQLGEWFLALGEAIMMAAKAMMALDAASLPLTWEAALIGLIALAIGLLVDDIWNWYHGNQSLFSDMLKKFPWLLTMLHWVGNVSSIVANAFVEAWTAIKEPLIELAKAVWDLIQVLWPILWPILRIIFGAAGLNMLMMFIAAVSTLVFTFRVLAFGLKIVAQILGIIVDSVTKGIRGVVDLANKITSLPGVKQAINLFKGGMGLAQSAFNPNNVLQPALALAGGGVIGKAGNSISSATHQTIVRTETHAPITVISNDPKEAGKSVKKELDARDRQTIRNGQSAVGL